MKEDLHKFRPFPVTDPDLIDNLAPIETNPQPSQETSLGSEPLIKSPSQRDIVGLWPKFIFTEYPSPAKLDLTTGKVTLESNGHVPSVKSETLSSLNPDLSTESLFQVEPFNVALRVHICYNMWKCDINDNRTSTATTVWADSEDRSLTWSDHDWIYIHYEFVPHSRIIRTLFSVLDVARD